MHKFPESGEKLLLVSLKAGCVSAAALTAQVLKMRASNSTTALIARI